MPAFIPILQFVLAVLFASSLVVSSISSNEIAAGVADPGFDDSLIARQPPPPPPWAPPPPPPGCHWQLVEAESVAGYKLVCDGFAEAIVLVDGPAAESPWGLPSPPPNCKWVYQMSIVDGQVIYTKELDCWLPEGCLLMTVGDEGGPQVHYIHCELPKFCKLNSGVAYGVTYWYISCIQVWPEPKPGVGLIELPDDPGTPVPPVDDEPQSIPPAPPNCVYNVVDGQVDPNEPFICQLPPECAVVTVGGGEGLRYSYIECDIADHCELRTDTTRDGTAYWYIFCYPVAVPMPEVDYSKPDDAGDRRDPDWEFIPNEPREPEWEFKPNKPREPEWEFKPNESREPEWEFTPNEPRDPDWEFKPNEPKPRPSFAPNPGSQFNCNDIRRALESGQPVSMEAREWFRLNCIPGDDPQSREDRRSVDAGTREMPSPDREEPEPADPRDEERDERREPERDSEDREPMDGGR
jgi:hypothetical protein